MQIDDLATTVARGVTSDGPTSEPMGQTLGQMRRVASAPAFKHASAYQAPSATAAVALAQADAQAESITARARSSGSWCSNKLHGRGLAGSSRTTSSASTTCCSSCPKGQCNCLEVYVVSRAFTEFGGGIIKKLPKEAKDSMVDLGLCHYMTIFRTPDGKFVQFDFGPVGGDIQKAHGPLAAFLRKAHAAALAQNGQALPQTVAAAAAADAGSNADRGMVHSPSAPMLPLASLDLSGEAGNQASAALMGQPPRLPQQKGVAGEIRERKLDALPAASMYMGRTQLSLEDIRQYNSLRGNMRYTLHDNDCRHYVNSLVQYATGVERSTQHLKRHYFLTRNADKWLWYGWMVSAAQLVTDVGNWSHVQAGAAVTLLAVTGRSTLLQLKNLALPIMPAITRSMPSLVPAAGTTAAGGSLAGTLATTLKLPATLLLKRPLAGKAVAAASGAGAAAAALRTMPLAPDSVATVAAAATSSTNAGSRNSRDVGLWGRRLKQWRDGLGQNFKVAVLTVRRLAVGGHALAVQHHNSIMGAQAAELLALTEPQLGLSAGSVPVSKGWFQRGVLMQTAARQPVAAQSAVATSIMALPRSSAVAVGHSSQACSSDGVTEAGVLQRDSRHTSRGVGVVSGIGQQVSRHVLWLGSTAAKATGAIASLASKQVTSFVSKSNAGQGAGVNVLEGVGIMAQSSSAGSLLNQQSVHQQQLARGLMSQRSKPAPSLAMVTAAAATTASDAGQDRRSAGSAVHGPSADRHEVCPSDDLFPSTAAASLSFSTVSSRSSSVGRQVLNLPAPRLSWGKRASHAVIVSQ